MVDSNIKTYIALFEENGKGGYGVSFPDVPGCISVGKDYNEAVRMGHEALAFHIEMMKEDGDEIPEPRTLEQIKETWEDWDEWVKNYNFIVGTITLFDVPDTSVKMTITMPASLVAKIDAVCRKRSTFLTSAAAHYLGENKNNIFYK